MSSTLISEWLLHRIFGSDARTFQLDQRHQPEIKIDFDPPQGWVQVGAIEKSLPNVTKGLDQHMIESLMSAAITEIGKLIVMQCPFLVGAFRDYAVKHDLLSDDTTCDDIVAMANKSAHDLDWLDD